MRLSLLIALLLSCGHMALLGADAEERRLIGVLQSTASPREKDAACLRLKRIGTEAAIPALASLLTDEQLSHSARYVLEAMQSRKSGVALMEALVTTTGPARDGIINSLGVRRESRAVPALGKLLRTTVGTANPDGEQTALLVLATLGEIATTEAIRELESVPLSVPTQVHHAAIDALLRGANRLLQANNSSRALTIFQRVYDNETADGLRVAAYSGMIRASGEAGLELTTKALKGNAGASQIAALQCAHELSSSGAAQALAKLAGEISPAVAVPLIESLSRREEPELAQAMIALAQSTSSEVRTEALTALGIIGDSSAVPLLAERAASRGGAEQAAAREALVRIYRGDATGTLVAQLSVAKPAVQIELARALGERGDPAVIPKLLEVAQQSDSSGKAALAALGQLADERHISPLLQIVLRNEGSRGEAIEALRSALERSHARGHEVDVTLLVQALKTPEPDTKAALLPVCSTVIAPELRSALRGALADSNSNVRAAASRALCETRDPELLPDLVELAHSAPEEHFRVLATAACVRLTTQEDAVKLPNSARIIPFRTLLARSPTLEQKRMLLAGLAELPDPEALVLTEPLLEQPDVQVEAALATIKIAGTLPQASVQSFAALKKVLAQTKDANTREAAAAALKQLQSRTEFITAWQVAGPYRQSGKNYAELFDISFPAEVTDVQSKAGSASGANQSPAVNWQTVTASTDHGRPGIIDLLKTFGGEQCVAYARARVYCPQPQAARLEIGSDDGVKVWLNGKLVHAQNVARPLQIGSDKIDVSLNAGWNILLLKVTQNNLGWEFSARLVSSDGTHLEGLQFAAAP